MPLLPLLAVLALAACTPRDPGPPRPAALAEPPLVAVAPFLVGGSLDQEGRFVARTEVPGDAEAIGVLFANRLAATLVQGGVPVVDPAQTAAAAELASLEGADPERAVQIGRRVGANVVVIGVVGRWVERAGNAWAAQSPASVAYDVAAVRTADGVVVLLDRFDYTQRALMENLLELPEFLRARGRWLTRDEIAEGALANTASRIAGVVGREAATR